LLVEEKKKLEELYSMSLQRRESEIMNDEVALRIFICPCPVRIGEP